MAGAGGVLPARWLRLVLVAATVVCLTPLLTSAVHVGEGWVPAGDTAIIALRSRDVFTADTPLLGQPSTAGATVGEQVHHPGPLEFWAIAIGQRLVDHGAVSLVVVTLVNGAAVVTVLWWLRSLAGAWGLAFGAVPIVTALWSLRGEVLVDPLNPLAAVVPLGAFLVSLVAAASGRRWALSSAVVFGSWAAQAHLTVTPLVVAAAASVALAKAVPAVWRVVQRRRAGGAPAGATTGPHASRRPLLVALALLVVCWAGPLADVVANGGGNVTALLETSGSVEAQPGGAGDAVDRLFRTLSWRPVWTHAGAGVPHLLAPPSGTDRAVVVGLWVVGLVAAAVNRRRAPGVAWSFGVATVVLVTGTALLTRLPGSFFNIFQTGNYLWLWPAGVLLWAAVVAGVLLALRDRLVPGAALHPALLSVPLAVSAAVAAACVVAPSHRTVQRDGPAYIRALSGQLEVRLDRGSVYGVDLSYDLDEQVVDVGILHELERRGFDLRVPRAFAASFGPRRAGLAGTDGTLVVDVGQAGEDPPPGPGAVLVASYQPPADLTHRVLDAELAAAERIDGIGGPAALLDRLGAAPPATSLELVRGDLVGLRQIGLLPAAVAAWPEVRALEALRALPVEEVRVHLLPRGGRATLGG